MGMKYNSYYFIVILFIGFFVIFKFMPGTMDLNHYFIRLRHGIVGFQINRLVFEKQISTDKAAEIKENKTVLYVLGGNQRSLRQRYQKASELYHLGLSKNIIILSRPGITEFTVIFIGPNSVARQRVKPIIPAFEAA